MTLPPSGSTQRRRCAGCGTPLDGRRSQARACGPTCRQRIRRAGGPVPRSVRLTAAWNLGPNALWRTPPEVFAQLDAELHFGLDAAAAGDDALCWPCLTPDDDALTASWRQCCHPDRQAAFCNPPYSKAGGRGRGLLAWAEAAVRARDEGLVVALLVPPAPSTAYHKLLKAEAVELRHFPRRLAFLHPDTGRPVSGNRGESMVALLRPGSRGPAVESYVSLPPPVAVPGG